MIVPNLTLQIHKIFFSLMNVTQASLFYSDGQMLAWWLLLVNSYERTVVKVRGYLILHLTMWSEGKSFWLADFYLKPFTFFTCFLDVEFTFDCKWTDNIWAVSFVRDSISCLPSLSDLWPTVLIYFLIWWILFFVSSYPKQNMIFWYFLFSVVSDCHEDMRRLSIKYVSINPEISEFKYKGCKTYPLIFLN